MTIGKKLLGGSIAVATLAGAGVVGATVQSVIVTGSSGVRAAVACPGGMSRLGHDFNEQMSIFPGDPAIHVENLYTVANDFFKVEDIDTGAHAGTHIDVPAHFIEGGRTLDQFAAEEFVWPAYKIDMRGMALSSASGDQLTVADIQAYEAANGRIRRGSLVVLQTGIEDKFGLDDPGDERVVDADDLAANVDDLFADDTITLGIEPDAVQWLFDNRQIDGLGTDAYGPDASSDVDFGATFTTLDNDGVAVVALKNLDSVSVRSDVIMAPAVNLTDGSGFSVDPLACHGIAPRR